MMVNHYIKALQRIEKMENDFYEKTKSFDPTVWMKHDPEKAQSLASLYSRAEDFKYVNIDQRFKSK